MKPCQKPATPVYHHGKHINDPDFDFEDSFCRRLNIIQGLADLFWCIGESGERQLTSEGSFGISNSLENATDELREICYKMLEMRRWPNEN